MTDEIQDLVVVEKNEVSISRSPDMVLAEAKKAADALKNIIARKANPVIIGGRQFLGFEEWALIAKFYGVVAKVVDSHYVEFGETRGFESTAVAFHINSGQEISRAYGMCMNDEEIKEGKTRSDWSLQRLRSFSQTRACSKVLKQVFSWVAVLGGYASTPAEELQPENARAPKMEVDKELSMAIVIAEIGDMIGDMCGGDKEKMDAEFRKYASWKDKSTGEEKSLPLDNVGRTAVSKPDWIRRIHKQIENIYKLQSKNKVTQA